MRFVVSLLLIFTSIGARAGQPSLLSLDQMPLDEAYREQLREAIITEAPGLVIVTDSENLKVSVFMTGDPARLESNRYYLVDVFDSSNGVRGHETPEGLFNLNPRRMKANDYSYTYGVPLKFTLFWRDLRTKKIDGVAFHAGTPDSLDKIGKQCASHGCVNLRHDKAEHLFTEVKQRFSSHANGSDVLILSSSGVNKALPTEKAWNEQFLSIDYTHRWKSVAAQAPADEKIAYNERQRLRLESISPSFNQESILIDSRRPIAGNGDTASSIYLIQNLIRRGFTGNVDILVDEKSERILKALSANLPGFERRVRLIRAAELSEKTYSLVIRSGLPSGRVLLDGINRVSDGSPGEPGKINVSEKTVFLSLTIYGNTENRASVQPLSLVNQGQEAYLIPSTGLSVKRSADTQLNLTGKEAELSFNEAGIFRDPFSLAIRKWSLETAEKFLIKQTGLSNADLQSLMKTVIESRKQGETKYSLAYGFSIPQVKTQARDYFRSLLASPTPTIVLTPSAFGEKLLQSFTDEERSRIKLTTLKEYVASGNKLEKGHLTVVQIPNVPHHIFSTLLLASNRNRIVPLGAGDGFFTTALSLGIPFAPTKVEWNIRNVRSLGRILQLEGLRQGLGFSHLQNLRRVFSAIPSDPIELAHSQQLIRYDDLFRSAIEQIPDLVENIDKAVGFTRERSEAPNGLQRTEVSGKIFTSTEDASRAKPRAEKHGYQDVDQCRSIFGN